MANIKRIFIGLIFLSNLLFLNAKAYAFTYPNDTLLKASNDAKIYTIWNGKKRLIRSDAVFNSYQYDKANVKTVSSKALQNLPINNLVRVEGDIKVYALNDLGYKRHIQNPSIFNSYGLNWGDVASITQTELDNYPETNLIRMDGDPKVYYLENGIKRWIPTADAFQAHNFNWDAIQIIDKEDSETYTAGANIDDAAASAQPTATTPSTQNAETSTQRYLTTQGGAVYDTVLKKFISPASTQTSISPTTQPSSVVVGSISLSASPSTIPADGKSTSIITAIVKDANNNTASNQTIYFSYGNITVAAVTDTNGVASITYTADTATGTVIVAASIGSVKNAVSLIKMNVGSLTIASAYVGHAILSQNFTAGQTNVPLGAFTIVTGSAEDIVISKIVITDALSGNVASAANSFTNLKLVSSYGTNNQTQIGPTVFLMETKSPSEATVTFDSITNFTIVRNQSQTITLLGDVNPWPTAVSGSFHTLGINANSDITAIGASLGKQILVSGAPVVSGGFITGVYKANLSLGGGGYQQAIAGSDRLIGLCAFTNRSTGNYSITVNNIKLGIDNTIINAAASRYVTLHRDSISGPILARKVFRNPDGTARNFADITDWTPVPGFDASEQAFTPFTVDAMGGSVSVYVSADTNDAVTTKSITTVLRAGSVAWSDGSSSFTNPEQGTCGIVVY